ncbi:PAS domain-containing sensor histidine kinase [Pseudoneobacillus sp. C159]
MVENQQVFEEMLNHTFDMLFIVNQNRNVLFATPNFYQITGYSPEELRNQDAFIVVHPDDIEFMQNRHKALLESHHHGQTEYRMISKTGDLRYFECKTTVLPNTEGFLQVVSTRDVTNRKVMELELERHKNRYEVLQKSLKGFSEDLSSVMKLTDLEERLLKELSEILPDSKPLMINDYMDVDLEVGKIKTVGDDHFIKLGERGENPYIVKIRANALCENMETVWLETLTHYAVMVFENLNVIQNLISQLESVLEGKESPQWVLRMMFNLQEKQRMNLSSDLHDTVLQDQIDLYRRLESILNRYNLDKEAWNKLKDIEEGLLDTIHQIRMTCNQLRPPLLRELGLVQSLENLFEHVQMNSTFKINFKSDNFPFLTEEHTIGIYRIVQELLENAEQHSRATEVSFQMNGGNGELTLEYCDDGIGFNQSLVQPTLNSMGLTSMNQRAQSLGGKIDYHTEIGHGLKAILKLPINESIE